MRKLYIAILGIMCAGVAADAAEPEVTVYGTVADSTGNRVPGAEVMFISGSDTVTAVTDDDGQYEALLTGSLSGVGEAVLPSAISLSQNYPNPFNPVTTIPFALGSAAAVRLDIFSITGQHVRTLAYGYRNAGEYAAVWDGLDDAGNGVSAGVYVYRLRAGTRTVSRKMLLLDGQASSVQCAARPTSPSAQKPATGQTYTILATKSTMTPYLGEIGISFVNPGVERDIVLPDQYKTHELFFDTGGILNQYAMSADSLGITLVGYHEPLPEEGTVTLISQMGDVETVSVSGSAEYSKIFSYCGNSYYYPDSRQGSIDTAVSPSVPNDGIIQVHALSDTISALYVSAWGDTTIASIPVIGSLETVELWGRTYYQWNDDWYWRDDYQRWLLAQKNDFDIIFNESVNLEVINTFLIDNNLQVGQRRSDYNMSIRIDNAIYFLVEQQDNPIIDNAELIEQGCVTF